MSVTVERTLLWLFVINLGIALGAALYEHRIVLSRWISKSTDSTWHWNPDAARQDDTGRRFWAFVTTVPLTLLTFASLIVAWRAPEPVRGWWLGASVAALADRLFTFAYFIPTMVRLMRTGDPPESVATAKRWANLNNVRHVLLLIAFLAALKAFSAAYQHLG